MALTPTNDSTSIFKDEKLRPGIYMIQNIVSQTCVDIQGYTGELCGRPAAVLEGKGLWEILPLGPGYTIRRLEPGKPEQFCTIPVGVEETVVTVATFPVAWRIEMVDEKQYRGCEYVRFFWGTTNIIWDLADYWLAKDYSLIHVKDNFDYKPHRIWKLIPVKFDTEPQPVTEATSVQTRRSGSLSPHEGGPESQTSTCSHQHTETSDDGFGTTVVDVTVTTTTTTTTTNTVTTRKKYRVEGE